MSVDDANERWEEERGTCFSRTSVQENNNKSPTELHLITKRSVADNESARVQSSEGKKGSIVIIVTCTLLIVVFNVHRFEFYIHQTPAYCSASSEAESLKLGKIMEGKKEEKEKKRLSWDFNERL